MKKKEHYFWRRFFAFIIDVIIISFLTSPLQNIIKEKVQMPDTFEGIINLINNPQPLMEAKGFLFLMSSLIALIALAYWTILEFTLKQSIGKILLGIQVDCKRISQVLLRNLSKAVAFIDILSIIFLIDVLFSVFHKDHQRLFEKWSKTKVIRK